MPHSKVEPAAGTTSGERPEDAGGDTVDITSLSKTFPGTRALDDVSLTLRKGEIHSLCGGNGSGKSTLIKILCGVHQGDPGGTIRIGRHSVEADRMTSALAHDAGVRAVHQDLAVFPDLTVAENLLFGIGFDTGPAGNVRWSRVRSRAAELIERFDIPARPSTLMRDLTVAARTQVAIARALGAVAGEHASLLILDEPTAALPVHEVELLLTALRRYADAGTSILYVSHRLDEVLELSDRITVLRDGRTVATRAASELDEAGLIHLMLGRQAERALDHGHTEATGAPLLEVRDLHAGPVRGVDLSIRPGEVVGIAGLLGSGRTELLRALFGDLPVTSGEMLLRGVPVRFRRTADAITAGVALVPENRVMDAAFLDLPVADNLDVGVVARFWTMLTLRRRRMRTEAAGLIRAFGVKATSSAMSMGALSGGNQQKVVMARWMRLTPDLLLLDEPTQGVDVGARADIYAAVRAATARGAAALVVASDFEELAHVTDRVIVLREGRVAAEVAWQDLDAHRLTELSYAGTHGA
ncbi:sugar ABC transporter ATP-binding protein [Streptomyces sp. NPDC058001]|uniref:sugar ABC transporter ATP-binding protein n=1 Tax=Streptomyces sp. NPDC058001 TaxID=3346300 RepID=UPI0036EB82BD